jgi:hypothetical protein
MNPTQRVTTPVQVEIRYYIDNVPQVYYNVFHIPLSMIENIHQMMSNVLNCSMIDFKWGPSGYEQIIFGTMDQELLDRETMSNEDFIIKYLSGTKPSQYFFRSTIEMFEYLINRNKR